MLCIEGRVALASFTVYALLALYQTRILYGDYWSYAYNLAIVGSASACVLILPYNSIVKRAAFLGMLFGGSIMLAILWNAPSRLFFIYLVFLSFFHFSEYMMTAIYNSHRLTLDSFLLNHSMEYQIAAVSSWIEFLVESYFFPSFKSMLLFNSIGFLFCFIGEILRKSAMITAKSNFSHIVQSSHNTGHKLVKSGIYAWTRHPSYVGWFVWSIGKLSWQFWKLYGIWIN